MQRLKDNIALVTGGSRGIGAAIAKRLGEEGAHVAINFPFEGQKDEAEQLAKDIQGEYGVQAIAVQADVSQKAQVDQMFADIERALGNVSILVNNAGIAPFESFLNLSEELWDKTFDTNVKSVFLTSQRAAKAMIDGRRGKIVNIASTASLVVTSPVIPHYIASKAAVHQLTKALAIELGKYQINVNAVGPSTTETDMCTDYLADDRIYQQEVEANPMKRLGTTKQIADAVVFLASEEAMQVNGHLLMVDGGLTVKAAQPEDHLDH
ncbi:SDR family NAD(P)-dependent oxidoreductase [Aureibacillus halotolerans]|uniref:3-oxoacyl-[acyl-carrier protein] reductase n=1 Tax=Aureibacillus halotolerans TaxID=1508390 RepID=A0A4R6U058_9BACI|nr:3-oxoacyl-ACP reductase family protein [Aureibacillus halotolerans]TDQ36434.1 3-oxoacyl-[acyl-carrier protein] reductase [Aureibacillus halotolerans]